MAWCEIAVGKIQMQAIIIWRYWFVRNVCAVIHQFKTDVIIQVLQAGLEWPIGLQTWQHIYIFFFLREETGIEWERRWMFYSVYWTVYNYYVTDSLYVLFSCRVRLPTDFPLQNQVYIAMISAPTSDRSSHFPCVLQ